MDLKLYYDTYVSESNIHKCKLDTCENNCRFIKFSSGYNSFCSISCSQKYFHKIDPSKGEKASIRLRDKHLDPEFSEEHSKRMSKQMKSKSSSYHKSSFLNRCTKESRDTAIFYIMNYGSYIKIGISTSISRLEPRILKNSLLSVELYESSPESVSKFEFEIKTNYLPVKGAEYFDCSNYEGIKKSLPKDFEYLEISKSYGLSNTTRFKKLEIVAGMSGAGKSTYSLKHYLPQFILPDTNVKIYELYHKLFRSPKISQKLCPDDLNGLTLWSSKYSADKAYLDGCRKFSENYESFELLNMRSGWDFLIFAELQSNFAFKIPEEEMHRFILDIESQFEKVEYQIWVMKDQKIIKELMSRNDDRSNLFNNDPVEYHRWQDYYISRYESIMKKFNYNYTLKEVTYT